MPTRVALATAMACGGWIALFLCTSHIVKGDINWLVAGLLAMGWIPGGWIGAQFGLSLKDKHLKQMFALVVGLVGVIFAIWEFQMLLSAL